MLHLFKECPSSSVLAFACKWGFRLEDWRVNSVSNIVEACINLVLMTGDMDHNSVSVFLSSFLYYVWLFRNKDIYTGELEFSRKIKLLNQAMEDFLYTDGHTNKPLRMSSDVWSPSGAGWMKANSDTAFSNSRAGLGVIVRNENGELVLIKSKVIDSVFAHAAEIEALVWASKIAEAEGWMNVELLLDAANVIKEIISFGTIGRLIELRIGLQNSLF